MRQHHAEVGGEVVGQMVPVAVPMEPDTRRVRLLLGTIRQIDPAVLSPREALADLEELAVPRIAEEHGVRAVLRLRAGTLRLDPRRVLRRRSRLPVLADVPLQRRETADLHATYREFLAYIGAKRRLH